MDSFEDFAKLVLKEIQMSKLPEAEDLFVVGET